MWMWMYSRIYTYPHHLLIINTHSATYRSVLSSLSGSRFIPWPATATAAVQQPLFLFSKRVSGDRARSGWVRATYTRARKKPRILKYRKPTLFLCNGTSTVVTREYQLTHTRIQPSTIHSTHMHRTATQMYEYKMLEPRSEF